jgi:transposase
MSLYAGCDLHSNNNHLALVDQQGRRVGHWKLENDPELILTTLGSQRSKIVGVVVESTYNWYWLVDTLMEAGYRVHLANPAAIQQYSGLKYADDKHDAFWLAQMLRLGILPEGYIDPKEERPVRDLLRKRRHLVRLRTSLLLSLQNIVDRNWGRRISGNDLKRLKEDRVSPLFSENEDWVLVGTVSKESIDFLTRQIGKIEKALGQKVELRAPYRYLLTLPGVGKILGLTIMLETGPICRFAKVGNYTSYCRKVPSQWLSNEKVKGKGNKKSGNKYLAWAFAEAAELARRFDAGARAYYQRKLQRTNRMVAHSALAHKLARAAYHVMRDQVPFQPERLFS